ncbi:MAG: AAA family ATPase [Anaerolineae bacterium]|nr:AAA family ATPase [Anaerolineae bacterium]
MRISSLQLQGFRSLFDITWDPGNLNIVIGPNGSGKSNLLRALKLLSLSASGRLSQQISREGGLDVLSWNGQSDKISFKILSTPVDLIKDGSHPILTYQLDLSRVNSPSAYKIDYEILGDFSQFERRFKPRSWVLLERSPLAMGSSPSPYFSPTAGLNSEIISNHESLLSDLNLQPGNEFISNYRNWLSNWRIYHDFLTNPDAPVRKPALKKNDTNLLSDGSNLIQVLHTLYTQHSDFKKRFDRAMLAAFDRNFLSLSFSQVSESHISLQINWKSINRPQPVSELSDGTLRFIYLLTILNMPKLPNLLAIDEPETGLHPCMLDIIAEYARLASRQTQLIFTTHSEKLLDAFFTCNPTVTITRMRAGKTQLDVLSGDSLNYWLKDNAFSKPCCYESLEEPI